MLSFTIITVVVSDTEHFAVITKTLGITTETDVYKLMYIQLISGSKFWGFLTF